MHRFFILLIFILFSCSSDNNSLDQANPISIDVWYGDNQFFGSPGVAQQWINILGNVRSEYGVISLTYRLNGAPAKPVTMGSDLHRLAEMGDFNIDLDRNSLNEGVNELVLIASDSVHNNSSKTIEFTFSDNQKWPLPYTINWSAVENIQDVVQVIDGHWEITQAGLRNRDIYYDRIVAFGDSTWGDYEVHTTVTFHSFTPPSEGPPTYNVSHAAIASRWPGHDVDSLQPYRKWYPLGATSEFRLTKDLDSCRWRIFDGPKPYSSGFYIEQSPDKYRTIQLDKRYCLKHRVETIGKDSTKYSVKMWPADQVEQYEWDFSGVEAQENVRSGGAMLIAHHTEVTFGNVFVFPVHDNERFAFLRPKPGDVFREYTWIPDMVEDEKGKYLRIGGKSGYKSSQAHMPLNRHENGYISFGEYLRLEGADRAEIVLEKVNTHVDTKGLRISINNNPFIPVPPIMGIPEPESDYMHHTNPVVSIPLYQLNEGWNNTFRLDVDSMQRWNWPQILIYGITLRIYYSIGPTRTKVVFSGLKPDGTIGEQITLGIDNPDQHIRRVDYLGLYEDVNYEGDGIYRQWHFHFLRGQLTHYIGSTNAYPFNLEWNTSWIPDQGEDIQLAARIIDYSGMIYLTGASEGLKLNRDYYVELCEPYDQPKNWVTREAEYESKVDINGDTERISEARLYWTSWSPCYSNGIYINDVKVFDKEGRCYEYMAHEVILDDVSMLRNGTNIIRTGKTPLRDGGLVHGMEVQWPGIMMLIKYQ